MNVDFGSLLSSGFIPGWVTVAFIITWYWRTKAANKSADAAIRGDEWKRLVNWNKTLQQECEDCHRREAEARENALMWQAEALKWKAAAEGVGIVRTEQAIAAAEERLAEKQRKEGEG